MPFECVNLSLNRSCFLQAIHGMASRIGTLSLLLGSVVAARSSPPAEEVCAAITNPAPCGQPNDGPELCGWKGCCWDASKGGNACFYPGGNAVPITHVHIVQACHFGASPLDVSSCLEDLRCPRACPHADAGYANTTVNIMNLWFHTHFPQAVRAFLFWPLA